MIFWGLYLIFNIFCFFLFNNPNSFIGKICLIFLFLVILFYSIFCIEAKAQKKIFFTFYSLFFTFYSLFFTFYSLFFIFYSLFFIGSFTEGLAAALLVPLPHLIQAMFSAGLAIFGSIIFWCNRHLFFSYIFIWLQSIFSAFWFIPDWGYLSFLTKLVFFDGHAPTDPRANHIIFLGLFIHLIWLIYRKEWRLLIPFYNFWQGKKSSSDDVL